MAGCENDDKVLNDWTRKVVMKEEASNVVSYMSQDGQLRAKLTAPLMIRTNSDTITVEFPKNLHCDFYNDSTKLESTLSAKYGRYMENENKIYLRDSVVIIRINGDTLETSELYWDQTLGRFHTDKPVTTSQRNPRQKLYARKGFSSNQTLTDITYYELDLGSFLFLPDSSSNQKQ